MKFSQIGRITKATILSLAIGLGMTACSSDYTIDFLYVTASRAISSSSPDGNISAYKVDNQSGALTQIADSPYDSGGRNPVAVVAAPNSRILFVLNHDTSSVVIFAIGSDGKIYPKNTYTLASGTTFPTSAAIMPDGSYLAVSYTYQPGYTTADPGPGAVVIFPVTYLDGNGNAIPSSAKGIASATLGTPVTMSNSLPYFNVDVNPVSLGFAPCYTAPNPCPSNYVPYLYVVEQTPSQGTVLSLQLNPANGTLASVASTPAGVLPNALAEDPTGRFVYVTDELANQLIGYQVIVTPQSGYPTGSLKPMVNGPFATALYPEGVTIEPRGKYLYVTNYNSSTVTGYAIDTATGTPSGVSSNGTSATGTGPTCVTVEPSLGIYLYTSNFTDNTVSGMQLDPHTGALVNVQNAPYNSAGNPTCAVAVSAGAHAYQSVQP